MSTVPTKLGDVLLDLGIAGWVAAKRHRLPNGTLTWSWWQGPTVGWGTTYDTGRPTTHTAWWPTRRATEQAARHVYGARWRRRLQVLKVTETIAGEMRPVVTITHHTARDHPRRDPMTSNRCAAAHPEDRSPCDGSADAVRVVDQHDAEVDACVRHARILLASIEGATAHSRPSSAGYTDPRRAHAIAAYQLAKHMPPFSFERVTVQDEPGTLPPERLAKVASIAAFRVWTAHRRDVTPSELRELAARAVQLAEAIRAVHGRLAGAEDAIRRTGYRLPDAAGSLARVGADLVDTASDLARVRGRAGCRIPWGCCPQHGDTLTSTGGKSSCEAPGCASSWEYDRLGLPCTEPPAYTLRDLNGSETQMCTGHAVSARKQVIGATITPLAAAR